MKAHYIELHSKYVCVSSKRVYKIYIQKHVYSVNIILYDRIFIDAIQIVKMRFHFSFDLWFQTIKNEMSDYMYNINPFILFI